MEYKIKSSAFNGKPEDWNKWSKKFVARAGLMGYKSVLLGVNKRHTDKGSKHYDDFCKNNDMAYADLLMACDDDVCFDLVENSRTEELPDGDSTLTWVELRAKFEPSTTMSLIALKKEFTLCCLTDSSLEPDIWIRELERIRRRLASLGHLISEVDLTIHILNNLPEDYENLIENLESEIDAGKLDLDKLKSRLRAKYRRLVDKEDKSGKKHGKVEKVLASKEHVKIVVTTGIRPSIARRKRRKRKSLIPTVRLRDIWRRAVGRSRRRRKLRRLGRN